MKEALTFYRKVQKQYVWLHIIFGFLLAGTAVFWFIVPLFIICYGLLDISSIPQLMTFIGLFIIPALALTFHCSFISFQAARQWAEKNQCGKYFRWFVIFQFTAFIIALTFTTTIYILFIAIDYIR